MLHPRSPFRIHLVCLVHPVRRLLFTLLIMIPVSDLFGEGWFKPFVLINMNGANSVIMILEILFLNSIKKPMVGLILDRFVPNGFA